MFKRFITIVILSLFSLCSLYGENIRIKDIVITGNKLTKDHIIRREIPFRVGDIFELKDFNEKVEFAKGNIQNLSLINYVNINWFQTRNLVLHETDSIAAQQQDTVLFRRRHDISDVGNQIAAMQQVDGDGPTEVTVIVDVEERWYIWPLIGIKFEGTNMSNWLRTWNFNQVTVDVGAIVSNMWGLNHGVSIGGSFGFQKSAFIKYGNISLDENGKHTIDANASYSMYKRLNVISVDNVPQFKFMKDGFISQGLDVSAKYTNRPILRLRESLEIAYSRTQIHDSVLILNPNYWGSDSTLRHTIRLSGDVFYDQRDNARYPLKGYYLEANLQGTFDLNTNFRMGRISLSGRYYVPMAKRWFFSTEWEGLASITNREAYIYNLGIGYGKHIIRGYERYTIDGQHYLMTNNTFRFCILPKKVVTIKFLSFLPKFNKIHFTIYAKAFLDAGYVWDFNKNMPNPLANQFLMSTGLGIDILTYYDITIGCHAAINITNWKPQFFFTFSTGIF